MGHTQFKFDMDHPEFQSFEREQTNHHSLFRIYPKRICMHLESDGCITRQIAKGRRAVSRERGDVELPHRGCPNSRKHLEIDIWLGNFGHCKVEKEQYLIK
jgi:hypothetical protein